MTKAKRITVVKKAFLHWRNEPQQGNSTSASGKKLLLMVKNNETCLDILKKSGQYDALKEAFFAHVVWANMGFYYRVGRENRKEYYDRMKNLLMNIVDDPTFKYTYFRSIDKKVVKSFTTKGGKLFLNIKPYGGIAKRKTKRLAELLFPTYKALNYVKSQNEDLMSQNQALYEEIYDLKNEIKNLSK